MTITKLFDQAYANHQEGNLDHAKELYQKVLDLNPAHAESLHLLGVIARQQGDPQLGRQFIKKAIAIRPDIHFFYNNMGLSLYDSKQFLEAIIYFKKAIRLKPDYADAYQNLAMTYRELGQINDARLCFENALSIQKTATIYNNYGIALKGWGEYKHAINHYQNAIKRAPEDYHIYYNLGIALMEMGQVHDAIPYFKKAITIAPSFYKACSNYLFSLNYHEFDQSFVATEHHRVVESFQLSGHKQKKPIPKRSCIQAFKRPPIRIGYISPDFRKHPVASFIEPILAHHNQTDFFITCYADVNQPDSITHLLKQYPQCWRDISRFSDNQVIQTIQQDKIDILVDLAGHTANNRLLVFAQKPAPIQVSYLGYPNTTGLSTIDYRFTDIIADPVGKGDSFYSETLVRLPGCFLCYNPPKHFPNTDSYRDIDPTWPLTIGSFNTLAKITPFLIRIWSQILHHMPGSKILLKGKGFIDGQVKHNYWEQFNKQGIDSDRVELIGNIQCFYDHLHAYQYIDIALDTFPYNGTTTTCESLFMGVPVVTLTGEAHASRVGASLLSNLQLDEFMTYSPDEYIQTVVQLAQDNELRRMLRKQLRSLVMSSILCNGKQLTAHIESMYRQWV